VKKFLLFLFLFGLIDVSLANNARDSVLNDKADSIFSVFKSALPSRDYATAYTAVDSLINIRLRQKDRYEWVRAMNYKAELLRSMVALDLALDVIKEAEPYAKKLKPSTVQSVFYNRKAAILYELKQQDAALEAVKESQRIDSIAGLSWQTLSNLNIEGSIYRDRKEFKKAQKVLRRSSAFAMSKGDTVQYCRHLYNLGLSFYRHGDYDSSAIYGKIIPKYRNVIENEALVDDAYRLVAISYKALDIYDSAYRYLDSAHINSLRRMETIIDSKVGTFRERNELEKAHLKNEALEAENVRSRLKGYLLMFALITVGLIAFIWYRQRSEFKEENEHRKRLNAELEQSLEFKNKLIGIVAHDIRNPMSSIIALVELYRNGHIDNEQVGDFMTKLESSSKQVNLLLENLLSWLLAQKGELVPNKVKLKTTPLLKEVLKEVQTQLISKQIQLSLPKESFEIMADRDYLALIIRNLITNSIKFSKVGGQVIVDTLLNDEHLVFKIQDFGVGMSQEQISQLLNGKSTSERGTGAEKGTGIGLQLVRELTDAHGGTLQFESQPGEGTTVTLSLPME
jgi:signal transduction histidine kinase